MSLHNDRLRVDGNATVTGNFDVLGDITIAGSAVAAGADVTTLQSDVAALEAAASVVAATAQTDDYGLLLADAGTCVEMNKGSAVTLTVPANADIAFPTGTVIEIFQLGAGQVTVAAAVGVTIRSSGDKLKLTGQYSGASLRKRATNEWVLVGDIAT